MQTARRAACSQHDAQMGSSNIAYVGVANGVGWRGVLEASGCESACASWCVAIFAQEADEGEQIRGRY